MCFHHMVTRQPHVAAVPAHKDSRASRKSMPASCLLDPQRPGRSSPSGAGPGQAAGPGRRRRRAGCPAVIAFGSISRYKPASPVGAVAQLGERRVRNAEVVGSSPIGSIVTLLDEVPGPLVRPVPDGGVGTGQAESHRPEQAFVMSDQPTVLGLTPSFGFGDRLGLATPGHLQALAEAGGPIQGVFAQQSIREMQRTGRTAAQVMADAAGALQAEGFAGPWGADADHLKTEADVDVTAEAGFVFFTIDPSEYVNGETDAYDPATLARHFQAVRPELDWLDAYRDATVQVTDGPTIRFDQETVQRAAVKYGRAINRARHLAAYIQRAAAQRGQACEIELSVDETPQPTSPAEHYIIAEQFQATGAKLVSLAPRFLGDFEKGVDYKGDHAELTRSLADHAAIARQLGPYKLSLHSGSDKLSMYAALARATRGLFHVKTAGTSYLEALRVVVRHEPGLFRRIVEFARDRYNVDKATYHVSATVAGTPAPADVADIDALERLYLECWPDVPAGRGFTAPGRQIMHCTFGSVLTDTEFGPAIRRVLAAYGQTHRSILADHFTRHLEALHSAM